MSDYEEIVDIGRKDCLMGRSKCDSPYEVDSEEHKWWCRGWDSEQLHTQQLAIQFSAKKENEETITTQEEQINKLQSELTVCRSGKSKLMDDNIAYIAFVTYLRDKPFWTARSYKKAIAKFCEKKGL